MMSRPFALPALAAALSPLALALTACGPGPGSEAAREADTPPVARGNEGEAPGGLRRAVAELNPTENQQARGIVTFTPAQGGVQVTARIEGLTPGSHGFHVHEVGDCSAPDASSAGDHFSPLGMPHGAPDSAQRHAGDFGNVEADASGVARTQFVDRHIAIDGANTVVGRAVIVHANADDLTSQPSGNAGARLACGVVREEPVG